MSFASQLDKTGNIKDETPGGSDGMGGQLPATWNTIYKRVKFALVLIPKGEQIIQYGKIDVFAEFFIYAEYLSGIKEGQQLHWNNRVFEFKLVLPWRERGYFMKIPSVEIGRNI